MIRSRRNDQQEAPHDRYVAVENEKLGATNAESLGGLLKS